MTGRIYDRQRWRKVRRIQLSQHPLCAHCHARGRIEPATDVDHIQPISAGGDPWASDNLQSLCHSHHSIKTSRDKRGIASDPTCRHGYPLSTCAICEKAKSR